MDKEEKHNKHHKRNKRFAILFSILGFLLIFRLILPYIVLKYVNNVLANLSEYRGHVEDIDLALFRGGAIVNDFRLDKIDKKTRTIDSIPFFRTHEIDFSIEWKSLFKGKLVSEIYVEDPVLNFVKGKHKGEDIEADTADFREMIDKLIPITVNRFQINNGQIHFIDKFSEPKLDIFMKNIQATANNLTNVDDSTKLLPASLRGTGDAYEGKFELNVNYDPLNKIPTFDMDASLKNMNLVLLNDFFKAYGNFDLKQGHFGLYTEFAAKDGAFKGYVKPVIKDIDVVQVTKEEGPPLQIAWEAIVGAGAEILQNQKKEQLATKIPIEGKFENPQTSLWTTINYLLRNAFVQALRPSIDQTINIGKVEAPEEKKTFLQKVFGKKRKNNS